MTDQAWFRLMLRGVGILLIGLAVPNVVSQIGVLGSVIAALGSPSIVLGDTSQVWWFVAVFVGAALQFAFGVYLLTGGHGLYRYCTRDLLGLCASCGYDIRSIEGDRCPECGTPLKRPRGREPNEAGPSDQPSPPGAPTPKS